MTTEGETIVLRDQLCFSVYSTSIAINRLYKPLLDPLGLTYPQYLVLGALWEENERSIGAIAERLALEPSTITPLVKRLEQAGFVARRRNASPASCAEASSGLLCAPSAAICCDRRNSSSIMSSERRWELLTTQMKISGTATPRIAIAISCGNMLASVDQPTCV